MNHLLSCEFNIDTACVELKYADGSMISIDTIAVENEVADNMYERSELDWLIFNAPAEYADLVLNGDPVKYLKTVTYRFLFAVYTETISALLIIHIHCTVFLLLTREEATFR